MIPITKNINVIDEQGNEYEATYLKRAKGLVKNGRARFVDERTLCLACPPNTNLEDKIMDDNKIKNDVEKAYAIENALEGIKAPQSGSLEWVCAGIDRVMSDTAHIAEAFSALHGVVKKDKVNQPGVLDDELEAITRIVREREQTNRQTLKLFEKMYDGLTPQKSNPDLQTIASHMDFNVAFECMESEDVAAFLRDLAGLSKK